jgi:outer membrane protein assembly factor BamB
MSRRPCLSLTVLASLLVTFALAQKPEEKNDEPALFLPTTDRYDSHLEMAAKRIAEKDWAVATTLLQKLLDLEDSVYVKLTRKGPDGKEAAVTVEIHEEADRLLSGMPAEGLAYYQQEYGSVASQLFNQARAAGDARAFARVYPRFARTRAGREALEGLAVALAERDDFLTSVRAFDQLLTYTPAHRWWEVTLFHAARVYRRVGATKQSEEMWARLPRRLGDAQLRIGNRFLTLEKLKQEFEKPTSEKKPPAEWRTFRGDATRSATSNGLVPVLEPVWQFDLANEGVTKRWLNRATEDLETNKQPVLSSSHPLTAVLKRKGETVKVVVYRSYWGVHARALNEVKADEVQPGEIYWEAPGSWSLDRMLKEPKHVGTLNRWLASYVQDRLHPGILFENATVGTISADSARVYCVDDFQVPAYEVTYPNDKLQRTGGVLGEALFHNRLQGYDLESGLLIWEIGAPPDGWARSDAAEDDAAESFFLSAPLPLSGRLIVLNEKNQKLRLMTLDPPTGRVLSIRTLATYRDRITVAINRRFTGLHLAHSDGMLVAPTHAGALLGVDAFTGRLLWSFTYDRKQAGPKLKEEPVRPRRIPPDVPVLETPFTWRDSAPMIAGGRVIYAPSDGNDLLCVNMRDGKLLWKHERKEGDVYVGGIVGEHVLVVGKATCRALKLGDGKEAWSLDTGLPSGLGVAVGGEFYLPVAKSHKSGDPEIQVIDVAKGAIDSRIPSRGEVPGNLVFHDGTLISHTTTTIAAYPTRKR